MSNTDLHNASIKFLSKSLDKLEQNKPINLALVNEINNKYLLMSPYNILSQPSYLLATNVNAVVPINNKEVSELKETIIKILLKIKERRARKLRGPAAPPAARRTPSPYSYTRSASPTRRTSSPYSYTRSPPDPAPGAPPGPAPDASPTRRTPSPYRFNFAAPGASPTRRTPSPYRYNLAALAAPPGPAPATPPGGPAAPPGDRSPFTDIQLNNIFSVNKLNTD